MIFMRASWTFAACSRTTCCCIDYPAEAASMSFPRLSHAGARALTSGRVFSAFSAFDSQVSSHTSPLSLQTRMNKRMSTFSYDITDPTVAAASCPSSSTRSLDCAMLPLPARPCRGWEDNDYSLPRPKDTISIPTSPNRNSCNSISNSA